MTDSPMKSTLIFHPEKGLIDRKMPFGQIRVSIGCLTKGGYMQVWNGSKVDYAHRMIWVHVNGPIPGHMEIDHINGNRSDNRLANLRLATAGQNQENRDPKKTKSSSGEKGVYWRTQIGRWVAEIHKDKKKHYLGSFDTVQEAKAAYCAAAAIFHTHNPCATK